VSLSGKHPAQMVRAAPRLHRHGTTPETHDEALQRPPPHPAPQNNPARSVQTRQAARVLTKINPNNNDVHQPVPLFLKPTTILADPGERGGPSHNHNSFVRINKFRNGHLGRTSPSRVRGFVLELIRGFHGDISRTCDQIALLEQAINRGRFEDHGPRNKWTRSLVLCCTRLLS
jgi:hypothetical protein